MNISKFSFLCIQILIYNMHFHNFEFIFNRELINYLIRELKFRKNEISIFTINFNIDQIAFLFL